MADGSHHSIGEVLSLLKEEHPDVTISKIRFLESQGLIDPERTPSGYRKFYQGDIDRLRWILTQQRDNFLPLKVIKRRVVEEGFDPVADIGERPNTLPLPEPSLFAEREPEPELFDQPDAGDPQTGKTEDPSDSAAIDTDGEPQPISTSATTQTPASAPSGGFGSIALTAAELADASGADLGTVAELEKMGLIEGAQTVDGTLFDHEAILVAKAAIVFQESGMELRHLRMYKVAADREIGMLHQLRGAGLTKGGSAAAKARVELALLVAEGEAIRRSLVRRALGLELER